MLIIVTWFESQRNDPSKVAKTTKVHGDEHYNTTSISKGIIVDFVLNDILIMKWYIPSTVPT